MLLHTKNPLLEVFNTPYGTPPFDLIKNEHYEPAFDAAIESTRKEITAIIEDPDEPNFENTVVALENSGERLGVIGEIFFNLNYTITSDEMQDIAQRISPKLTTFSNEIYMNLQLFNRVKQVYSKREELSLTIEQYSLLEKTWRAFIDGGANLQGTARERFKYITIELAKLGLSFEKNVLAETNAFSLHITDERDLSGLPSGIKEEAAEAAKRQSKEGWIFTLHSPSYLPFMKYSDNRKLREKIYKAYSSRCFQPNNNNNEEIIKKITSLRFELAKLLGYNNYAEYVLTRRMAKSPVIVNRFIEDLYLPSYKAAIREKEELEEYAHQSGLEDTLRYWDWGYYSNKLKQERYAIDDETIKPYFKLDNVCQAVFELATRLYGITFKESLNIPRYHPDVNTYEVYDKDGSFLAILYTDFFPRESKGGGAWMTEFRGQYKIAEEEYRPFVSIVMNFTKATKTTPSLLTFSEVNTLLHEFGHALHGILSQCNYRSLSGTNVFRDFVELPSQIMENWALEKEWLDTWAVHYQTGESIPADLIEKIKRANNFQSGYASLRQLSFAMVDMAWHTIKNPVKDPVVAFESKAMARTGILPQVEGTCFSTAFTHIFGGGYAAGYYSYKWAEVLDADAFTLFKERGVFDIETATSFRKNILEKGGTEPPMELYKRFRGAEPTVDALLERSALKKLK